MKTFSRREYMKMLGAGAVLATTADLEIFGQKNRRGRRRTQKTTSVKAAAASSKLRWLITHDVPPATPFVSVIFGGLMGFSYEPNHKVCPIGFLKGGGQHEKKFTLYTIDAMGRCDEGVAIPSNKDVSIRITSNSTGPRFYENESPILDRYNATDAKDFRWLPDLHSSDFYPEGYDIQKSKFSTRLYLYDGTVYTRQKTNSTFVLVDKNDGNSELRKYGHVAAYMAAAIDLSDRNDSVRIEVDNVLFRPLNWSASLRYQIVIENECHHDCEGGSDLHSQREEKRNDFHFNRKALALPNDRIEYALMVEDPKDPSDADFCPSIHRISDSAPCMGSGYGQGSTRP